jgi:hypothetical protein
MEEIVSGAPIVRMDDILCFRERDRKAQCLIELGDAMPVRTVGCFRGAKESFSYLETVFFLRKVVDVDSSNMADLLERPPLLRFSSLLGDHI